jgi:hypothetical protein
MAYLVKRLELYNSQLNDNNVTEANRIKLVEAIRVTEKQITQLKPKLNHD